MRTLLQPKWIVILNTIPLLILSAIMYNDFLIIKSLLKPVSLNNWYIFSSILFLLFGLSLFSAIYFYAKKQLIPIWVGFISLLAYLTYIYTYYYYIDYLVPFDIPNWMISGNLFFHVGTFLMPTFIHSILILVLHFTDEEKNQKAWVNFLYTLFIPILFYLLSQIIIPLSSTLETNFGVHSLIIAVLAGTIVFLFFLFRSIYILAIKKEKIWTDYQIIWKLVFCLIFPLLGLLINNGVITLRGFSDGENGIFGNFNSNWFYILAVVNGILLCIPAIKNIKLQLLLFTGRCITLSFTLYFFFVFIPYLPISIPAIIFIGVGFLMLTPIILTVIHAVEIAGQYKELKTVFSATKITLWGTLGFIIIPTVITLTYAKDRTTLINALEYVYNPDYSKTYDIDATSLKKTLHNIRKSKKRRDEFIFGEQIPYLNTFYNWIVLDNLTLSDTKINYLEQIFFDEDISSTEIERTEESSEFETNITSKSTYDPKKQIWISTISFNLTNLSSSTSEYATHFEIPEGCLISDYYLYIGKKKERGLLAEKKSALWVYSNIVNENKDPGIIYYLNRKEIALRVFPFLGNETRNTEIELIHKEPISLTIDNKKMSLGEPNEINENQNSSSFVTTSQKSKLKKVNRKPYFHFIIDVSKGNEKLVDQYINSVEKIIAEYPTTGTNHKISLVNNNSETYNLNSNWKEELQKANFEGGFYLDRGIKKILFDTYNDRSKAVYPIIVTLTDAIGNGIIESDFSNYNQFLPEQNVFYNYKSDGSLDAHRFDKSPKTAFAENIAISTNPKPVLEFRSKDKIQYLADNDQGSILMADFTQTQNEKPDEKDWNAGIEAHKIWVNSNFHPENYEKDWLYLIGQSFKTKIMNPHTSYMVVENEAQKEVLKQKQKLVMSGNKALDLDEESDRMSEPNILILLFLSLGLFFFKKR